MASLYMHLLCCRLLPCRDARHLASAVPMRVPISELHVVRLVVPRPVVFDNRPTLAGSARAGADDHCVASRQSVAAAIDALHL